MSSTIDTSDIDKVTEQNSHKHKECSFEDILESLDSLNNRQLCRLLRRIRRLLACGF